MSPTTPGPFSGRSSRHDVVPPPAPSSAPTAAAAALPTIALVMALALSVIALTDAVTRGVSGGRSPIDEQHGVGWLVVVVSLCHGLGYAVFAGLLVRQAAVVDGGHRLRRWIRRVLVGAFAALAVFYLVLTVVPGLMLTASSAAVAGITGLAFAASFLFSAALGVSLLTRREFRPAAWLLTAQLPLLGLTLALEAAGSNFAHPAYLEVACVLGVALLGRPRQP